MLSTETITKKFRKADLPDWAREIESVVWLCKRSLPFRVDVHRARTRLMRQLMIREADAQFHGV